MKNGPRFGSALLESPEGGPGGGWGSFTVDMSIVSSPDIVIPGHERCVFDGGTQAFL